MDVIKVATKSRPTAVAGAIAAAVREDREANVQAIGPLAVNQAMKAIAVARGYLAQDGLKVVCIPTFIEVPVDGGERTALRLLIEPR
jgi:stage V sporulation protein S